MKSSYKSGNLCPRINKSQNDSENKFSNICNGRVIEIHDYLIGEICKRKKKYEYVYNSSWFF